MQVCDGTWDSKKLYMRKKVRIETLATCIELTNLPSMSYEGLIDDVKFIGSTLDIEEEINFFSRIIG